MALDATVGGANANSYANASEVDAYIAAHPFTSGWTDTATNEPHLKYATVILDNWFNWDGVQDDTSFPNAALEWPRSLRTTLRTRDLSNLDPYDVDTSFGSGRYDPADYDGIVPDEIKNAQIEMALHLAKNTKIFDRKELENVNIGNLKIKFDTNKVQLIPSAVLAFVEKFGAPKPNLSGGASSVRLVRV